MQEIEMESKLIIPKKEYKNSQKTIKYCSIELYPESESYDFDKVFEKIKEYCKTNQASYVSMLHDLDYYTEDTFDHQYKLIGRKGQKKSAHVHCLLSFGKRVDLNGFANTIGIEERWIKILKHDYDFDNMIVYLTHIKYDESIKHHYSPSQFDSNISDYCQFIYDNAISEIESNEENIVTFCLGVLKANKSKKVTYEMMLDCVLADGTYNINDYNKYYRVIKDLISEHNLAINIAIDSEKEKDMIAMLKKQIGELQHNLEVSTEINMELRGISFRDSNKDRWKE